MITINDRVFGRMEYDHYWKKRETILFWGKETDVIIGAKSYKQRPITPAQQEAFAYWNQKKAEIEQTAKDLLEQYASDNDIALREDNLPVLTTILFTGNREIILLFDCMWDPEHGFAVQAYPERKAGTQDLFL